MEVDTEEVGMVAQVASLQEEASDPVASCQVGVAASYQVVAEASSYLEGVASYLEEAGLAAQLAHVSQLSQSL